MSDVADRPLWPPGGGEMAGRVREHDWTATPLGPIDTWSPELRFAAAFVLENRFPAALVWGPHLVTIYNDGFRPILGSKPEALGRSFADIWLEVWPEIGPIAERAFSGQSTFIEDYPLLINRSGEPEQAFFTFSYSPVRAADGKVLGLIDAVVETTGRVLAERAREAAEARLHESEVRSRRLVEHIAQATWETDGEGVVVADSPSWRAYTGQTPEEWLGYGWADAVHPDDRAYAERHWREAVAAKREVDAEFRLRCAGGGWRWTAVRAASILNEDGTIQKWVGMNIDIDARKRAEAALRESEARLRAVLEQAPLAIAFTGTPGEILFRNAMFDKLWGRPAHDTTARTYSDVYEGYHLDGRPVASEEWPGARAVLKGEVVEGEVLEIVQASGRRFTCWFAASPIRDEAGRITGGVVLFRDVSEERRTQEVLVRGREELEARVAERTAELMTAEEGLRQAQKMEALGQLTGGIAHDFNNMLQGVTGGLEMARRRIEAGRLDDAARYLDAARDAAARAAGLTQRLLAFARHQRLDPRLVDADGLIAGLADLVRRTVGPGIEVELRLRDGAAGGVLCDPGELESALLNLCINARYAMPEGGRLTVGTEDVRLAAADVADGEAGPGRYVAVAVADTGTGMAPEVLERAFEPFFTTKPQGQGTGLGLSQIWGFARQSGGVAQIESAPGRGTTVRLLLPLHEGAAAGGGPRPAPPPPTGAGGTVLLVDDEGAVRGPAADRLRELGHTVLEARDGPEALRILASARPDLLVTDVGLPNGMNGRQVAEAARERVPGLPVLFITGYAGTSLPPGMEVIGKPFGLDALARRVQAVLEAGRRDPEGNPGA